MSCEVVGSALEAVNTLTELDMSHNNLGDSGIEFLYEGLRSRHCHLQILRYNLNSNLLQIFTTGH